MKVGIRTVNNALFNAISGMLPLILSFVFWPYIVDKLGDSSYGIFALVGTIIGYFALLDLGLGNAVVKYVAEYNGKNDTDNTNETIGVALTIFMTAGLLGVLIILALAKLLATRLLKIPPDLVNAAYLSFCAASLGFFFTMILTLLTAITNGLNRYDISSITTALMGTISTIGAVVLLHRGFGLVAVVWLNVAVPFLVALFYLLVLHRLLPGKPFRFRVNSVAMKRILHFGMYAMLSRITDVIVRQVDLLIIGALLGVASVTYYVIPFTILNRMTALLGRIGMVIFPAISELQGQNRQDTIRELYITSSRIILSFALAFTVPLLVFGTRFLYLWMNPEFAARGGHVIFIITIGVLLDLCSNVPTFVVDGLGRPKVSGFAAVSHAVIFLAMMIPGAIYGGITGVALAFTLSTALVIPGFIWYVNNRVLNLNLRQLLREALLRPVLAGILTAIPLLFIPRQRITHLFILLFVMGCGAGLYFIVALCIGVYEERERRVFVEYVVRVIQKFKHKDPA